MPRQGFLILVHFILFKLPRTIVIVLIITLVLNKAADFKLNYLLKWNASFLLHFWPMTACSGAVTCLLMEWVFGTFLKGHYLCNCIWWCRYYTLHLQCITRPQSFLERERTVITPRLSICLDLLHLDCWWEQLNREEIKTSLFYH